MNDVTIDPEKGSSASLPLVSERARVLAETWIEALRRVNPMLDSQAIRETVMGWSAALVSALVRETFDSAVGLEIGAALEALDSMQPEDLQRLQETLLLAMGVADDPSVWQQTSALLFAVGTGFFAAKAKHASELDMAAQSRMSHDLKTPINAINGFSRVILKGIDGPITDFQQEDLTSIYEAGQKLLTMINDVFSAHKHDAARTLMYHKPYLVAELLADVVRTVQPYAGERDHTFEIRMVGDIGLLSLDASMVRWILLSLLNYVIRQISGGVITVGAEMDANELLFTVTGLMPESLLAYTDDAHPESPASAPDGKGDWPSDIGLITCRNFCEQLGGHVKMISGEDLTFHVRLPAEPTPSLD